MSENPVVLSVIIPVYNAESTIGETLDSLLGQSLKAIEVICVDDGSRDGSVRIIREYMARDARVSLIRQQNLYAGTARNAGIDAAVGEYLYFLDADDYVLDYALEAVCDKARRYRLDCLKFLNLTYDEKERRYVDKKRNSGALLKPQDFNRLLKAEKWSPLFKISVAPWSGIYRRAFVLENGCRFNRLLCVNDRSFHTKVITTAKRIMISRDRVVVHRINQDTSLVGKKSSHFDCQIDSIRLTERQLAEDHLPTEVVDLVMQQEFQDLMAWYRKFSVDPARKEEMDRQLRAFLDSRDTPYDAILRDMIRYAESMPAGLAPDETLHPVHEACEQPRVTVLVPVTGEAENLTEALDSLTHQTLEEMEFLLLDNGAAPGAEAVMREYAEVDRRFALLNLRAAGKGELLNRGLEKARGAYVSVLEPDDFVDRERYQQLYREADADRLDVVLTEDLSFRINEKGSMKVRPRNPVRGAAGDRRTQNARKNDRLLSVSPETRGGLFRREFLRQHQIQYSEAPGEFFRDAGFLFQALCCADRVRLTQAGPYMARETAADARKLTAAEEEQVSEELQRIHGWLSDGAGSRQRFEAAAWEMRLRSMMQVWGRVAPERKQAYLNRLREELKPGWDRGMIRRERIERGDWERMERMMNAPEKALKEIDISVIIPVYNAGPYLEDCLRSVLKSPRVNLEVLCVDDGSTDGSQAILEKYREQDSRVSVIRTENRGAGAARNEGLKQARGTYCAFLDADDFFEPEMLDLAWEKAEAGQLDVVVFPSDNYFEETGRNGEGAGIAAERLPEKRPFAGREMEQNVFRTFVGWAWDKLFRTAFLREKELRFSEIRSSNDLALVFAAVAAAERIDVLEGLPLAHHRRYPGSVSNSRDRNWQCYYEALTDLREQLRRLNLFERFERDFVNYAWYFSLWQMTTVHEEAYRKIYDRLKEKWLEDLGIAGKTPNYFYDPEDYELLRRMQESGPVDFLLFLLGRTQEKLAEKPAPVQVPDAAVTQSASYRIGRALTWLPRKVRTGRRLIRERGVGFALKYGAEKGKGALQKDD